MAKYERRFKGRIQAFSKEMLEVKQSYIRGFTDLL